jgi:hypothetical protein
MENLKGDDSEINSIRKRFEEIDRKFDVAYQLWPRYALELGNTDGYPLNKLTGRYFRPQDLPMNKDPFDKYIRILRDTRLPEITRWQGPTSDNQWIQLHYVDKNLNYSKMDNNLKFLDSNNKNSIGL